MPSALRILVVDDRLDSVGSLVDKLQRLRHLVDTTDSSMEALSLVNRKASAGHPYHLLLTDLTMPLLDGVGLVRELQRRGERIPAAFISDYASAAAKVRAEGAELGVLGVIGRSPTDPDLQQLLNRVHPAPSERLGAASTRETQDAFFGTARVTKTADPQGRPEEGALARARLDQRDQAAPVDMDALLGNPPSRKATSTPAPREEPVAEEFAEGVDLPILQRRIRTPDPSAFYTPSGDLGSTTSFYKRSKTDPFITADGLVDPKAATPPPGTSRDPVTGNYRRQPSGLIAPDPNALPPTTTRVRRDPTRSGTGSHPPPGARGDTASFTPLGQPALPPAGGITSGFRRSLTGKASQPPAAPGQRPGNPPPPPTTQTCTVSCAHCNGLFQVLVKPAAYTVLCVHCGQLNRIDPLPGKGC